MARKSERRTWSEWFRGDNKTKARKRLAVEILEDRAVPATVTNLLDGTDPFQPIPGSLRAAIIEAARDTGPNAGKVDFDPGLFTSGVPQTLVLNGAVGAIVVNSGVNISITGPGAGKLRIQSDYGFTPGTIIDLSASPTGSGYKVGQSLRQVPFASPAASGPTSTLWTRTSTNDTAFSAPPPGTKNENYFGAAVFQVSEVDPNTGAIKKVSIQNGGSNSIWLGTKASGSFVTLAPGDLVPLTGNTGTGASFTVPDSAYSLNPGLFTLQMPSSGAFTPTFTLSGLTLGATLGDAITQNSGNLAVQSCVFATTDFQFGGTTPLVQSFISAPANSSVRNITVADSTFTGALAAAISHDSTGTVSVAGLSATNTTPLPALANTSSAPTTASLSSASNVITASAVNNLIGSASVTAGFPASATLSSSVPSPNAGIPYGTARTIQAEDAASGATALLQDDGFLRSVRVQTLSASAGATPGAIVSQALPASPAPLASSPIGGVVFINGVAVQSFSGAAANGTLILAAIGTPSAAQLATAASYDPATGRVTLTYAATPAGNISLEVAHTVSEINLGGTGASMVRAANILQAAGTELAVAVAGAPGTASQVRLVSINADGTLTSVRSISLPLGTPAPVSIATGDVNGDGRRDLALVSASGLLTVLRGTADDSDPYPSRLFATTQLAGSGFTRLALADLNNDGRSDAVAVASASATITTALGTTTGGLSTPRVLALPAGSVPAGLAMADIDNDGKQDITIALPGSNLVNTYFGRGTGEFYLNPLSITGLSQPSAVIAANLAGSSLPDILITSQGDNGVILYENLGDQRFRPASNRTTVFSGNAIAIQTGANNKAASVSISAADFSGNGTGSGTGPLSLRATGAVTIANSRLTANQGTSTVNTNGTITFSDSVLANNSTSGAATGAILALAGSKVDIANSRVTGNNPGPANTAGTVSITAAAGTTISSTLVESNIPATSADTRAVNVTGPGSVSNSVFKNNSAGGALAVNGDWTVNDSWFGGNAAKDLTGTAGFAATPGTGGAAIRSAMGNLAINRSVFEDNIFDLKSARSGGGAVFFGGSAAATLSVADSVFSRNAANIYANPPAIPAPAPLPLTPDIIPTARYSGGGAIRAGSATVITNSLFEDNKVTSAVDFWSRANPTTAGNPAYSGGGAAYLSREFAGAITNNSITNTTFTGNSVQQTSGDIASGPNGRGLTGGAIITAEGRASAASNYVTSNQEPFLAGSSTTRLVNSTITKNSVDNPFATSGNSNRSANPATLSDADSGGIFNDTNTGSAIILTNMINVANTGILYDPATGTPSVGFANFGNRYTSAGARGAALANFSLYNPAFSPGLASTGNNLLASEQNSGLDPRGLIADDPDLAVPAATKAGTTPVIGQGNTNSRVRYIAPDRLSPVRDAGTATGAPATDVRGLSRNINFAVDMGAVELQTVTKVTVDPATLPGGNTLEYGQTHTITVQVVFDDSKANANPVTGKVHIVSKTDDTITAFFGTGVLVPVPGSLVPTGKTTIQLNSDLGTLLNIGINTLYAIYDGDANYSASDSQQFTVLATPATTTVTADTISMSPSEQTDTAIFFMGSAFVTHPANGVQAPNLVPEGSVQIQVTRPGTNRVLASTTATLFGGRYEASISSTDLGATPQLRNGIYDIQVNFIPNPNLPDPLTRYSASSTTFKKEVGITPGMTITLSSNLVQRGDKLIITASLNPEDTDSNQPGSVTLTKDGTDLITIPRGDSTSASGSAVNRGVYSVEVNTGDPQFAFLVRQQPYTLSARYNRNDLGIYNTTTASTSSAVTIDLQDTIVSLLANPTQVTYGDSVFLLATVSPTIAQSVVPFAASAISFFDSGRLLGAPVATASETQPIASIALQSLAALTPGVHSMTAFYGGGGDYKSSFSTPVAITVNKAPTTTIVNSNPVPAIVNSGNSVTFSIAVTSGVLPGQGVLAPTGTITLASGNPLAPIGTPVQINSNGTATISFTPSSPGIQFLTFSYSGDSNYESSFGNATVTVPAISLEPFVPGTVQRGENINLTARLTPFDSLQNGSVDFIRGSTIIASIPASASSLDSLGRREYSALVNTADPSVALPVGNMNVVARYNANGGPYPTITSGSQPLTVIRQTTSTSIAPISSQTMTYGQDLSFIATVAATINIVPIPFTSSQISFFDGSKQLQASVINDSSRSAIFRTSTLGAGIYNISAKYLGDASNYSPSSSLTTPIIINKAATTSTIASSSAGVTKGDVAVLTATVSANTPVTAMRPTGTVNFFTVDSQNNRVSIGQSAINPSSGVATLVFQAPAAKSYRFVAEFSGDNNYLASDTSGNAPTIIQVSPNQPFFAVAMAGGANIATFNPVTNELIAKYTPNTNRYTGGFTVARGDVTGDGVADLLWATNRGSFIRIIDGRQSIDLGGFFAFNSRFNGPVSIAVGDMDGDGRGDIAVAPAGRNNGGIVRVFSGADTNRLLHQYAPYGNSFGGGISIAAADVDGDNLADIITVPMAATTSRVVVVSGASKSLISSFLAHGTGYRSGANVAASDLDGDGRAEIIIATNVGRGLISVFSGTSVISQNHAPSPIRTFTAPTPLRYSGGLRVGIFTDADGDGLPDLLVTMGPNGGSSVLKVGGRNLNIVDEFFAFSSREPGANNGLRPA